MPCEIYCKLCDRTFADTELLCIYKQNLTSHHLIVKIEKRNSIIDNLHIVKNPNEKKAKFAPNIFQCANLECCKKLGSEMAIGPKAEKIYCIDKEAVYLLEKGKCKQLDILSVFNQLIKEILDILF